MVCGRISGQGTNRVGKEALKSVFFFFKEREDLHVFHQTHVLVVYGVLAEEYLMYPAVDSLVVSLFVDNLVDFDKYNQKQIQVTM